MRDALPFLLPLLFPVVFVAWWCFICFMISRIGGWNAMAAKYRANQPPEGAKFRMRSAKVGLARYNNTLTLHGSVEGLHLAVMPLFRAAHPPIFLPWAVCRNPKPNKLMWLETVTFEVGVPKLTTLTIPKEVFDAMQDFVG